ncbi:MAG: preprotein translocase subunit SecA, partial [Cryobacterium sp.]|nr:preprotein translocase subunit SecA [Cryobacterium sp.]
GNAEFLAVAEMNEKGLSPVETPDEYEAEWDGVYARVKKMVETEAAKVVEVGGLYVLGTERHESRRIDNQLRGRSGRQGDPGESRFYLSLADDLMRLFNSAAAESLMGRGNVPEDLAIESKVVSRAIRSAQGQVEARNAEIRKNVLKYDDVLNRQREAIYGDRRHILEGDDLKDRVEHFLEDVINEIIDDHTGEGHSDDWNLDALWRELKTIYPISITIDELFTEAGSRGRVTRQFLGDEIMSDAKLAYQRRTDELGEPAMRELERRVVLSVIDRRWRDHLYEMDYLKDGIGLRAMAQRDPLVEYQREGFILFQNMMGQIREETVSFLFNLEVEVTGGGGATASLPQVDAKGLDPANQANQRLSYSAPSDSGGVEVRNQRGQLEQAATAKAQQAAAAQANQVGAAFGAVHPGQNQQQGQAGQQGQNQQGQNQQGGQRGAFGQRQDGPPPGQPAPMNRAERRAQEKNKRH